MSLERAFAVALLAGLAAGCNNENINVKELALTRFQIAVSGQTVYLLDGASGDLWRLNESGTAWQRQAERPADVRAVDLGELLAPPTPTTPAG